MASHKREMAELQDRLVLSWEASRHQKGMELKKKKKKGMELDVNFKWSADGRK